MNLFKLTKQHWKRIKDYRPSTNLRVVAETKCPYCKADAGYFCVTPTGKRHYNYHSARFTAYIQSKRKAA